MAEKPTYEELEKRVHELEQAEYDRKKAVVSLIESETRHRMKLVNILLPEGDVGTLGLSDIMNTMSVQSMMDDFFKLTSIGVAILDLNGKILVATGWQDICTKFHRVHPETCNNCHESDIHLSNGVEPGTFRLYRCKNNMWDIATPIIVGGKRMGNLFLGQFIFSDESLDMDIFRTQARKYGFNEEEYLAALERVPRWSRETVNTVMTFYAKLAHQISELSFGNLELARTLMERDNFLNSLLESEKNLRTTLNSIGDAVMASDKDGNIVRMNPVAERLTGWSEHDAAGKPLETVFRIINEVTRQTVESPVKKVLEEGVTVGLANHTLLISKDGKDIPVADSGAPIKNDNGKVTGVVLVFRDQTEERAAQKALEDSQERFQALHNASFGGICIHDKGIILDCNQGLTDMTGFTGEELIGMNGLELIAPEWRKRVMRKILSGYEQSYDVEGLRKDGTIYHLRIQGKNIPYQGRSVRVTEFRDITERKQAEEKIQAFGIAALRNESRLRRLLDILQHPSQTIQDFLDYALEQAIQLTESKIGYIYHYDERSKKFILNTWSKDVMAECSVANPSNCYELDKTGIWGEAVRQRRPIIVNNFQTANPLKKGYPDGHVQLVKFMTVPIFKDDRIVGVVGLANKEIVYDQSDILQVSLLMEAVWKVTERKQAEMALQENNELLTLFVRHSPVYCYIKDVNSSGSVVLQASDNFQQMIGIPGSEMIGKTMEDLYPPEFAAKITADDWTVVSKGDVLSLDEELNGRSYSTIKFPIVQGGKTLLAGYTIDITDRKRAESEKAKLDAQTQQLQKAESLNRMAGAIAHHFNNLLGAVIGNLELAGMDMPPGSDAAETLSEAMRASHRAAEVSRLMLTYIGQTPGKHEPLDLSEICHLGLSAIRTHIPDKVVAESELHSPGPTIQANTNQIQLVLANLVTNAWESISGKQGTIRLTVKTVSPVEIPASHRFPIGWQALNIPYACLEVSDTGGGIPDSDIEKIFDPFFTTKFTGRGLGLPVVLGIVGAHDGGITVESKPGIGSVFQIFFPVSDEVALHQPDKTASYPEIQGAGTVLLIEDEEQVRNMAKIMLTRLGYTVLEARDGIEAVEIFQQHQDKIRCVLSDLTMPRMNGWETLAALRKISPHISVILSSGYDEARVMAHEPPERPNAFLGKPYQLKGLRETINRVLTNMS